MRKFRAQLLNSFLLPLLADQNRNHDGNKFIARCYITELNESRLRHNADAWRWFRETSCVHRARCAVRARFAGPGREDAAEELGFEAIAGAFNSYSAGKFATRRCILARESSISSSQVEGVWSTGVIPKGTRFGPFEGHRTPSYPSDKSSWRYFWRVSVERSHASVPICPLLDRT